MTYQPAPAPAQPQMPPQPAPRSSGVWLALVGIAVIVVLGVVYWIMMQPAPGPTQPSANEQAAAAITAEANIVAQELDALSTGGLDAELDQIDAELAQ